MVEQVRELTGGTDLDAMVLPIGGGGLISGVATAMKSLCPGVRIIGAQPHKAADAFRSKQVCSTFLPREAWRVLTVEPVYAYELC